MQVYTQGEVEDLSEEPSPSEEAEGSFAMASQDCTKLEGPL